MSQYTTIAGELLDEIVWFHYGVTQGAVEVVLQANPGLADHGPVLPAGVIIKLPDYTPPQTSKSIRLWD
ncbi:tail protein X [Algicola sagamiensis]|uniref:tail protein X n=1 Tax=Algicola sagamiensis TaxID=163869 RepID=UPI0003655B6C|nr:tail protein X [Algicola sagamiensis]